MSTSGSSGTTPQRGVAAPLGGCHDDRIKQDTDREPAAGRGIVSPNHSSQLALAANCLLPCQAPPRPNVFGCLANQDRISGQRFGFVVHQERFCVDHIEAGQPGCSKGQCCRCFSRVQILRLTQRASWWFRTLALSTPIPWTSSSPSSRSSKPPLTTIAKLSKQGTRTATPTSCTRETWTTPPRAAPCQ